METGRPFVVDKTLALVVITSRTIAWTAVIADSQMMMKEGKK